MYRIRINAPGHCVWLLLIAVFGLAACGTTPPKVTLAGTVRNAYTDEPIEGALVVVGQRPGLATNDDGAWQTQGWSNKDQVVVVATGYQSATLPLAERPDLSKPGALTASLDVSLRPDTLTGVISDSYAQKPLVGAVVEVIDSTPLISATTDTSGRYTLEGLPEEFQLAVRAADHAADAVDLIRTTEFDLALRPNVLAGVVKDQDTDQPLADVEVRLGEAVATTDAAGRYTLAEVPESGELVFSRDGYDQVTTSYAQTTSLDEKLRSNQVAGVVTDAASGQPLADAYVLASTTFSSTAVSSTRTDQEGRFVLANVPKGAYLKALMPGYRRGEVQAEGATLKEPLKLEPIIAKALYVKTINAVNKDNLVQYFDVIDQTELNTLVLDLKSDNIEDLGRIYYASQVPIIRELGTSADRMDLAWILAEAKKRNIYTIARIHVFSHDNELVNVKPDWYVQKDGKPWYADFGVAWLDAYNEEVWNYNIALAVEAVQLGFDEINFDYIRFPSDGDLTGTVFKGPRDWRNNPDEMYDTIGRFLERAQQAVNSVGGYSGGDVFGYAAWEPQPSIGQNLQVMGRYLDYVYPMVYPSHFVLGELGFENPGAHPYEIVAASMQKVKEQLTGPAARAKVRPWLQDFTLIWVEDKYIVEYGREEVRAQIDAAEANQVAGWALWDSDNDYTISALNK